MRIEYAIMGSTTDWYYDFWPIVSQVWKKRFNITPVLGLISDKDTDLYDDGNGLVKEFKLINSKDTGLQSQVVRLYLPKYLNGVCITSDIDIIPISKKYFIEDLVEFDENDLLVFSSSNESTKNINQYPMCYVACQSKLFHNIFNLEKDWVSFVNELPNHGWYTDQIFLYEKIKNFNYDKLKFLPRDWEKRIDRMRWEYDEKLILEEYYIDSHLLRPYFTNKQKIDKLINYL